MPFANNHIDKVNPSNYWIFLILFIIGAIAAFFALISRKLSSRLVEFLNTKLNKLNSRSTTLLIALNEKEVDFEEAKKIYPDAKKLLSKFKGVYSKMERVNFFGNPKTHKLADGVLLNFYSIESNIRMIALSEEPAIREDKNLIDAASELSLGSLQA